MRISGFKPLLIFIVIAVVVAGLGFRWWQNRTSEGSKIIEQITESKDIQEFSLGGEVLAIDKGGNQLTLKTGWVQKTDNGNQFVYTTRSILIYVTTKISSTTKDGTAVTITNKEPLDAFHVGSKITVYGSGNPITDTTLLADRVEIQQD